MVSLSKSVCLKEFACLEEDLEKHIVPAGEFKKVCNGHISYIIYIQSL